MDRLLHRQCALDQDRSAHRGGVAGGGVRASRLGREQPALGETVRLSGEESGDQPGSPGAEYERSGDPRRSLRPTGSEHGDVVGHIDDLRDES